jgi:hypothetical protein
MRHIRGPTVCPAGFRRTVQAGAFRDFITGLMVACYALIAELLEQWPQMPMVAVARIPTMREQAE